MEEEVQEDIEELWSRIREWKKIGEEEMEVVWEQAKELFWNEQNVVEVQLPVTVWGDLRGQLNSLLEIFKMCGEVPETNYVFLGNYTNIGNNSVELIAILFALKVQYPNRIFLLRGSDEFRIITQNNNFYGECMQKFNSDNVWNKVNEVFDSLPLWAVISDKVFWVHSGLTPYAETIEQINLFDRSKASASQEEMGGLFINNPWDIEGWKFIGRAYDISFGSDISESFNHAHNLITILRSHQLVYEGYQWHHDRNVWTIFSAPGFKEYKNIGAVMQIDDNLQFTPVEFDESLNLYYLIK